MIAGATHPIRSMVPRCLGIAMAMLALSTASAVAAPVDRASDHVALRAFDRYLRAMVASMPAAKRADQAYVRSISASCRDALGRLRSLPARALGKKAATVFIEETVFDLVDRANLPLRRPLARMTSTLSRLRWSDPRISAIVAAFPAAERSLFGLAPSDLCADAHAFAANPHVVPPGTRRWVATFRHASQVADKTGSRLGAVLGAFHGPRDLRVLRDIGGLARRLGPAEKRLETTEEARLLRALGVHA